MKILVGTDGSEQSHKAIEAAAKIAGGCNVDEVTVIHVYEPRLALPYWGDEGYVKAQDLERFKAWEEQQKEESRKLLPEAAKIFEDKSIKVNTIFEEGHPAETIVRVALEEEIDMVVLGSRGLGGLKKLILGSVSNAVIQEIKSDVLIVK